MFDKDVEHKAKIISLVILGFIFGAITFVSIFSYNIINSDNNIQSEDHQLLLKLQNETRNYDQDHQLLLKLENTTQNYTQDHQSLIKLQNEFIKQNNTLHDIANYIIQRQEPLNTEIITWANNTNHIITQLQQSR